MPSLPLISANLLSTYSLIEDEWTATLQESVRLADELGMDGVRHQYKDIAEQARALECSACYGTGTNLDVRAKTRRYIDCNACQGSSRKDGAR